MRLLPYFLVLFSLPVWADITATWATKGDQALTVSYRDDQHVRMDLGPDSYLLMSGDKVWMLNRDGGQWSAMDMAQMKRFMPAMPRQPQPGPGKGADKEFELVDTGRTETVAGYEGKVWRAKDARGRQHEAVVSDHPDILKVQKAMLLLTRQMAGGMGAPQVPELPAELPGGVLRYGDDMRLKSVEKKDRPADWFSLPANAEVMEMMPPGGMAPPAGQQPPAGGLKKMMRGMY